jgi:hypothetical protein
VTPVFLGLLCIGLVSWACALVFYLRMMARLDRAVVKLHSQHLWIKSNLLFLARPDLFVGAAATYRRWYIAAALAFLASIVAAGVAIAWLPR